MPRYGNIFGFNQFRNQEGELLTVVYHEENYLIVYDKNMKELWRSNDRFGGSELFYQVEDLDNVRVTGDRYRWFFLNQRIQVTSRNEVLVGKNEGFFVLGNARMYKKGLYTAFTGTVQPLKNYGAPKIPRITCQITFLTNPAASWCFCS